MAREKQITRAMEVTICKANKMRIVKKADENGNVPAPTMREVTLTLLGTMDKQQALFELRNVYEIHTDTFDTVYLSVDEVTHKWQLRTMGVSTFFSNSNAVAESNTFDGLRAKAETETGDK